MQLQVDSGYSCCKGTILLNILIALCHSYIKCNLSKLQPTNISRCSKINKVLQIIHWTKMEWHTGREIEGIAFTGGPPVNEVGDKSFSGAFNAPDTVEAKCHQRFFTLNGLEKP